MLFNEWRLSVVYDICFEHIHSHSLDGCRGNLLRPSSSVCLCVGNWFLFILSWFLARTVIDLECRPSPSTGYVFPLRIRQNLIRKQYPVRCFCPVIGRFLCLKNFVRPVQIEDELGIITMEEPYWIIRIYETIQVDPDVVRINSSYWYDSKHINTPCHDSQTNNGWYATAYYRGKHQYSYYAHNKEDQYDVFCS